MRLAVVELQLIMQHCDLRSLLAFARCSKQTMAAGLQQFAWRDMRELVVVSMSPDRGAPPVFSELLQFCHVSLRYTGRLGVEKKDAPAKYMSSSDMDRVHAIPRVHALQMSGWNLSAREIHRLLAHNSLRHIRTLNLGMHVQFDQSCIQLLLQNMPQLTSLRLQQLDTPVLCALLAQMPQLSDVRVSFQPNPFDNDAADTAAASLQQPRHLRRMVLTPFDMHFTRSLLSMPISSTLEELTLRDVNGAITDAPLFAPLIALRRLRIGTKMLAQALRLFCVAAVECPALRELHSLHDGCRPTRSTTGPESMALAHELVQVLPAQCHVWLHLERLRPAVDQEAATPHDGESWIVMQDPWTSYRATLLPNWNATRIILQNVAAVDPERMEFQEDPPRENDLESNSNTHLLALTPSF